MAGAPVELLHRVPLFADLDDGEVAQIARSFKERRFSDGETVIKEGFGGCITPHLHLRASQQECQRLRIAP